MRKGSQRELDCAAGKFLPLCQSDASDTSLSQRILAHRSASNEERVGNRPPRVHIPRNFLGDLLRTVTYTRSICTRRYSHGLTRHNARVSPCLTRVPAAIHPFARSRGSRDLNAQPGFNAPASNFAWWSRRHGLSLNSCPNSRCSPAGLWTLETSPAAIYQGSCSISYTLQLLLSQLDTRSPRDHEKTASIFTRLHTAGELHSALVTT